MDLHTLLNNHFQELSESFLEDADEAGVLTSWVLVAEWVGTDGRRWMTNTHPPEQTTWTSRGLLTEAVHDLP